MSRQGGLGRGLGALIPTGAADSDELAEISISSVAANPRQPRAGFEEQSLAELAESIRQVGLLQPIIVRPADDGRYQLVAGERRLRAAKAAGMTHLPAIVRKTDDNELLRHALMENVHRSELNPLEEAAAYQQLLEDFDTTHDELAERMGKSRPAISNALRLLKLPPSVQRQVAAGVLSAGHAKAILTLEAREQIERLAERIVREGLSVRATEEIVRLNLSEGTTSGPVKPTGQPSRNVAIAPSLAELQDELSDALEARVSIVMGKRKGKIQIEFRSVDDLERIVGVISSGIESTPEIAPAT